MPKTCSSCHCCPYGFHIDRDFVAYCDSLYNSAQLDKLKQKKRERRKEQITVESCLGISALKPISTNRESEFPPVGSNRLSTEGACFSDLDNVMSDFEDTWQKSLKKKASNQVIGDSGRCGKSSDISEKNEERTVSRGIRSHVSEPQLKSQRDCNRKKVFFSEVEPEREQSTFKPFPQSSSEKYALDVESSISQDMALTIEKLSQSKLSDGAIGIQRDVLSNIREQMATSLRHMKELEEQVKAIPILKVKLSAVNEEKTVLLKLLQKQKSSLLDSSENATEDNSLKLPTENMSASKLADKKFNNVNFTSSAENLASPALASNLNDTALKRCFVDSEIISHLTLDENSGPCSIDNNKTPQGKDMKNVGTSCYVLTRDVGVGHIQSKCKSTGVGDENILKFSPCFRCSQDKGIKQSICISSDSLESDSDSAFDIQAVSSHQKQTGRFPRKCSKSVSTPAISIKDSSFLNKKTVDASTCSVTEVKQVSTLTDLLMRDVISNTELERSKRHKKNKSVQCDNPLKCSKATQKSDETFNAKILSDCDTKFVHDDHTTRHDLRQTETIGVGESNIHEVLCSQCIKENNLKCDKTKEKPVMSRSIGINTFTDNNDVNKTDIHICDKCNAAIQSIAQDFASQKREKPISAKSKPDIPVMESRKSVSQSSVPNVRVTAKFSAEANQFIFMKAPPKTSVPQKPTPSSLADISSKYETKTTFDTKQDVKYEANINVAERTVDPFETVNNKSSKFTETRTTVDTKQDIDYKATTNITQETVNPRTTVDTKQDVDYKATTNITQETVNPFVTLNNNSSKPKETKTTPDARQDMKYEATVKKNDTAEGRVDPRVAADHKSSELKETKTTDDARHGGIYETAVKELYFAEKTVDPFVTVDHKSSELKETKTTDDARHGGVYETAVKERYFAEKTVDPFVTVDYKRIELNKEVKAACKVLGDYLQKPDHLSEKKMLTCVNIIKKEWFQIANQKHADPHVIEGYLDAFEEISRPLLECIVNFSDINGNTAIHYAVSYSNFDAVSILVDSKVCDVNKQNKAGYTCIMLVALADMKNDVHNYVVQRLFNMGDINIKAKQNGQTALMLAVSRGKLEIVKMLIEAGSEINLQDNDGSTALMCAAEHGQIEIVKVLLSHPDCDPTILDSDGCNALTIAMEAGYKDIGLLIYANMNFSRGSSPYSSLKQKRRAHSRSTPPPRTPTLRTPSSPSARSTSSLPSAFHFTS